MMNEQVRGTDWRKVALWAVAIALVWPVQYVVVVPIVLVVRFLWTLVKIAMGFGLIGILLLLIPVLGWIILALWYFSRRADKRNDALIRAISTETGEGEPRKVWSPWLLEQLRAA